VADPGTMTTTGPPVGAEHADGGSRAVRRPRTLPGGRAVVGALLIAAAAVGVFAAYLDATAEPDTSYLVAQASIAPGTRLEDVGTIASLFQARAIDLAPDLAARAIALEDAESLVGRVVIAPVEPGDLLVRSGLVADGGVADATKLSFSIDRADAVAGTLEPGERIDVLATYGSGDAAYTAYVVRGVPLLAVSRDAAGGGLGGGSGGPLTLTVAVTAAEDVQALAHAVATADLVVTRSTVGEGDTSPAPGPYVPSRDRPGPAPDVAGDPRGIATGSDPTAEDGTEPTGPASADEDPLDPDDAEEVED
jgi:pilus assembly protein CpaB